MKAEIENFDSLRKSARELQDENRKLKAKLKEANIPFEVNSVSEEKIEDLPNYDSNCHKKDWEADYHCSKEETRVMLSDAVEDNSDMKILEQFDLSAINCESLEGYRNCHRVYKPEHVFHRLSNEEYLIKIGAAARTEDGKVHPTGAGLLMFGEEYNIVREFPKYFLDYQEMLDPTTKWIDRVQSNSGDWTGNIQDFFFKVSNKIAQTIKTPFKLDGITRIDDTPVHKAVREALISCLVNADYNSPQGIVIKREITSLIIEYPGSMRTRKKQILKDDAFEPRNKNLMKMFNLIGFFEKAGDEISNIYQVWENQGWTVPIVEESYNPDRTRLVLEFTEKQVAN